MSESMSEADSDTDMRLFGTSDTDSDTDMDKVMTSDTDTGSDTHRSDKLGHEFGLGHAFRHDVRVSKILLFLIRSILGCGGFILKTLRSFKIGALLIPRCVFRVLRTHQHFSADEICFERKLLFLKHDKSVVLSLRQSFNLCCGVS